MSFAVCIYRRASGVGGMYAYYMVDGMVYRTVATASRIFGSKKSISRMVVTQTTGPFCSRFTTHHIDLHRAGRIPRLLPKETDKRAPATELASHNCIGENLAPQLPALSSPAKPTNY